MRNIRLGWVVCCALAAATSGCRTPSHSWNGTWKLDPAKSTFQGPVFRISLSPAGDYRYEDGIAGFLFRCDGEDRPAGPNRTEVCVKNGATEMVLTRKDNGVKANTYDWQLSEGGKALTLTATAYAPGGPEMTAQIVASRLSGSGDFAGDWQDTTYLRRHDQMTLALDGAMLHLGYPDAGQTVDASLQGIDAAMHGPHAQAGVTYAVRPEGPLKFAVLTKRGGKPLTQGSLELSADGQTVTYSWWRPDRPKEKGSLVYDRQ